MRRGLTPEASWRYVDGLLTSESGQKLPCPKGCFWQMNRRPAVKSGEQSADELPRRRVASNAAFSMIAFVIVNSILGVYVWLITSWLWQGIVVSHLQH